MPKPATEERVNLIGPDGSPTNVPISEAQAAIDAGYRVATDEDVAAEQEARFRTSAGEQVKAGLEGTARGLTLGLSDAVATRISTPEDVLARKEANPELALGTELAGAVAPVLFSGGTGAVVGTAKAGLGAAKTAGTAGKALRVAGAAPRAVASVGNAVERGAAGLLGKGVLARAGSVGAAGAVEGAIVGAGQAVSSAALLDNELTGEMVVAGMGHGALLGGAAGGALGAGVGLVGKAVTRAGTSARALLPEGAFAKVAKKGDDATGVVRDGAGKVVESGGESFAGRFTRQQRAVKELDDVQQAEIRSIRSEGTRKEELFDAISDDLDISNKVKSIRTAIDEDVAVGAIAGSSDEAVEAAGGLVTALKREVDEITRSVGAFEPREIGAAKALKKFVDETDLQVRKLRKESGAESRGELFAHLDALKRRVGRTQERIGGRGTSGADDVVFTAGGILRAKYDEMAAHLVDPSMYGRAAADIQAPDNVAWSNWFDTRDAYRKMFLTDAGGARTATGFSQVDVMSPENVGSLVKGLGRAEGELKEEMFRRSVVSTDELVEQLAKSHSVGPKTARLVAESRELGQRMIAGIDTAKATSVDARAQRELLEELRGFPMAEAVVRVAVTAAEKTAMLVGMRKRAAGVSTQIDKAAKAAVSTAKEAGKRAKSATRQSAARTPRRERFDRAVERVTEGARSPVAVGERITDKFGDHAVASSVVGTVVRGQAFLRSKMPAPMVRDSDRQPHLGNGTQRVASSEMSRWLRYVKAVEDPMSVVRSLENGTLTKQGAEALRTVHPRIYEHLKTRVGEGIADAKDRIPRSRLVRLSVLFDEPYHFSMEPTFLLAMQQNAAGREQEAQQGDGFIAPSARKAPDTSDDHMTKTQRISQ